MPTVSPYWTRLCERGADRNPGLGDDFTDLRTLFATRRKSADDFRRTLSRHGEQEPARRLRLGEQARESCGQRWVEREPNTKQGVEIAPVARHAAAELTALRQVERARQQRQARSGQDDAGARCFDHLGGMAEESKPRDVRGTADVEGLCHLRGNTIEAEHAR